MIGLGLSKRLGFGVIRVIEVIEGRWVGREVGV